MARLFGLFQNNNQRRRRKPKVYENTAAMRLGIDLTRPDTHNRTRSGGRTAQPELRHKRSKVSNVSAGRSVPSVMVRSTPSSSVPLQAARTHKKAKRRYDVSLGMPGTEVRLPGLPQIRIGWRWLSAVLVIGLGAALYMIWNAPTFRVAAVEVSGLQRLTSADINAVLGVANSPIFVLDSEAIKTELMQAFPEFSEVSVQIGLPNAVKIEVTERVPVLTWMLNSTPTLVDASGVAFPARGNAAAVTGPIVEANTPPPGAANYEQAAQIDLTSIDGTQAVPVEPAPTAAHDYMSPEFVQAVLSLSEHTPAGAPLLYDGLRGFGWRDPGGWDVYFGDAREIPMKLLVYQEIIALLDDREETFPSLVSVESVHAPYYKPR